MTFCRAWHVHQNNQIITNPKLRMEDEVMAKAVEDQQTIEDRKWVNSTLNILPSDNVVIANVVTCALQAMKKNPFISVGEAMTIGLNEY